MLVWIIVAAIAVPLLALAALAVFACALNEALKGRDDCDY